LLLGIGEFFPEGVAFFQSICDVRAAMVHGGRLLLIVGSLNTGCNYIYSYSVNNFLYFVKG
ncbi:hypothetical protein, partial [Enterocloster bolteae]|uniref:hypothetical protein n=1 Tax=Enterocloster bolteae TaxID=208479 RepID=UPI002A7EAF0F